MRERGRKRDTQKERDSARYREKKNLKLGGENNKVLGGVGEGKNITKMHYISRLPREIGKMTMGLTSEYFFEVKK